MSDDNKIYKSAVFNLEASAKIVSDSPSSFVFSTQDKGVSRLVFNCDKGRMDLPLSYATSAKLAMRMADGSRYTVNPEISDRLKGQISYLLTDEQLSHSGKVVGELYIEYPEQRMQIQQFSFTINKALIDSDFLPVVQYYVERWDKYEAIFDESFAKLDSKLNGLEERADEVAEQLDGMDPEQFAKQTEFDAHKDDAAIHVTTADKIHWSAKESTVGAQVKADKALADAIAFFESSSEVHAVTLTPKGGFIATQPLIARYVKFGTRFLVLVGGIVGKGTGNGTGVCASVPTFLAPETAWNKLFSASQQSSSANNRANVYISVGGDISIVAAGDVTVNTGLDCVIYFTKEVTT
ncbi:BppU family phage baseplate upper protein [Listeria monocytogenes]